MIPLKIFVVLLPFKLTLASFNWLHSQFLVIIFLSSICFLPSPISERIYVICVNGVINEMSRFNTRVNANMPSLYSFYSTMLLFNIRPYCHCIHERAPYISEQSQFIKTDWMESNPICIRQMKFVNENGFDKWSFNFGYSKIHYLFKVCKHSSLSRGIVCTYSIFACRKYGKAIHEFD